MNYKNLLQIYSLLICTVSIIIIIISTGIGINNLTKILAPEYTNYSSLARYDSNESYLQSYESWRYDENNKIKLSKLQSLSPDKLAEWRKKERTEKIEAMRRHSIENLILGLEWFFVGLIFFFIHWRLNKKIGLKN